MITSPLISLRYDLDLDIQNDLPVLNPKELSTLDGELKETLAELDERRKELKGLQTGE